MTDKSDKPIKNPKDGNFLDIILTKLKNEVLSEAGRQPVATPLLLFKVLLDDEDVKQFFENKSLNPEPLIKHVSRLVDAHDSGQIREAIPSLNYSMDPKLQEVAEHEIDKAFDATTYRKLQRKDPSSVTDYSYEPELFEMMSGYVAEREMKGQKPSAVGLFEVVIEEYGKLLGKPIEECEELIPQDKSREPQSFQERVQGNQSRAEFPDH